MAVTFVQAGTGLTVASGIATLDITGATAGNLLVFHIQYAGLTDDWTYSDHNNIQRLDGTLNDIDSIINGAQVGATRLHAFQTARVTANGTCSVTANVGASGEDLFARIYEFSGASLGTSVDTVFEGDNAPGWSVSSGTGTTVSDAGITTLGPNRLALQCVALASNQAIGDFTGESGGDWTEAAEYQSAAAVTGTLQLQTAPIASAGTINGGTVTVSSIAWGVLGTAIIPGPDTDTGLAWIRA